MAKSDRDHHACYAVQVGSDHFRCRMSGCGFDGTLSEAIRHVVENQFDARWEARKP